MNYAFCYLGERKFMPMNVMFDSDADSQLNDRQIFTYFRAALEGSGLVLPPNKKTWS